MVMYMTAVIPIKPVGGIGTCEEESLCALAENKKAVLKRKNKMKLLYKTCPLLLRRNTLLN